MKPAGFALRSHSRSCYGLTQRMKAKPRSLFTVGAIGALLSGLVLPATTGRALDAVPRDIRQSWEDDYASLKAALSKRDNRYALLRTGDERKDVAHIQSLLWESDRTPADVALRRIDGLAAALEEHAHRRPILEPWKSNWLPPGPGTPRRRMTKRFTWRVRAIGRAAGAGQSAAGFRRVDLQSLVEPVRSCAGSMGQLRAAGRRPLYSVRAEDGPGHRFAICWKIRDSRTARTRAGEFLK